MLLHVSIDQVDKQNTEVMVDSVKGPDGKLYGVLNTANTWFLYYNSSKFSAGDIKSLDTMLSKGKVAFPLDNSWYIAKFYVGNGWMLLRPGDADAYFSGSWGTATVKTSLGSNYAVAHPPSFTLNGNQVQMKAFPARRLWSSTRTPGTCRRRRCSEPSWLRSKLSRINAHARCHYVWHVGSQGCDCECRSGKQLR